MHDDCLKSIPYDPLDLILLDRNFGHYYRVAKLLADRRPFCIRMSVSCSDFAERSMADPRQDFIICWEPSKSEWETSPGASPITDRVTKTILKSGVEELLVSSMTDMVAVNLEDMVKLYSMRWGVEEGIKNPLT